MGKTRIEWCDFSINPVKGLCPVGCSYCYARRMYKRFGWNPEIRFIPGEFDKLPDKPCKVFVGSTIELFGDWVKPIWMRLILDTALANPQHTFIFLTKQPQNLIMWSPYPENAWVGVSATNGLLADAACAHLSRIDAKVKFLSIEPLLEGYSVNGNSIQNGRLGWQENYHDINWVIIGAQTPFSPRTAPKIEWVREIVEACDKASVPVFLKDSLFNLWDKDFFKIPKWALCGDMAYLRQELPV